MKKLPELIDTHAHVNFNAYKDDVDEVIKRTLEEDFWMINVGSQRSTSERAVKIAEKYKEGVFASVGLHPFHLFETFVDEAEASFKSRPEEFDEKFYENLAKNNKVVAIGECGLDYSYLPEDKAKEQDVIKLQKEVFKKQLNLAKKLDLPIIIHCRDAHEDMLEILENELKNGGFKAVMHCYTGDWKTAQKYLNLGLLISFTGLITFKVKPKMQEMQAKIIETIESMPIKSLMVETDAPYLTPEPHRGKRNEPLFVKHVTEKIAEIKGLKYEELAKITTENAIKFFNL